MTDNFSRGIGPSHFFTGKNKKINKCIFMIKTTMTKPVDTCKFESVPSCGKTPSLFPLLF